MKFKDLCKLLIFNIKYYRYVNNYLQEKLTELSKLTLQYITDIEQEFHFHTISKLEVIAQSLNIESYQVFMNIEREKNIIDKLNNKFLVNNHYYNCYQFY